MISYIIQKVRPLQDRIVVKSKIEGEASRGGLVIPDSAREKPIEGTVVAVGNRKALEDGSVQKMDIKEGDTVLYGKVQNPPTIELNLFTLILYEVLRV